MDEISKLKPIKWGLIFALILIASLACISLFAIADAYFDEQTALDAYGFIWLGFAVFNLILWIIRKDLVSLSFILINLTIAVSYFSDYKGAFIAVPIIVLYLIYFYLIYVNHKIGAHYRRILELAAQPVDRTTDGFTPRPLPAGKHSFSGEELSGFAKFLKKHRIAIPYFDQNGILLAIKDHSRFWFGRPSESRDSYVAFNYDGTVAVNIARKDYQKYKEEYTFDELCHALGDLFIRFLEYYRDGKEANILEELSEKWNTDDTDFADEHR